ncbi:MAG: LLM class flavin-dependent oxidoreductase [Betaproteobacteria bacterium]|nr:LLM class flavin-dependent oxidoreductase [Betaproteobacteria bacterium]
MNTFGVAFDGRNTIQAAREQAKAAEAAGAGNLWVSSHLFLRDPFSSAATLLEATGRVRLTLMAVSPHVMHPVHIAMAAMTLEELAPGRVALCMGTGAPVDLADAGVEAKRPLRLLTEAVESVRLLLSGEQARYAGELVQLRGRRMAKPAAQVPIYLAASQPKMLELAGRIADGVVLSSSSSVEFVRWSLDHFDRGAQARKVSRAGLVYAYASDNTAEALGRFRRQLGITLRGQHHATNLSLAGSQMDQAAVRDAMAREDWAAFETLVSDDTVRRHAACGTADQVRARVAAYRAAGLDEVVLAGLYTPEETRRTAGAVCGGTG